MTAHHFMLMLSPSMQVT